ncbi:MAG: hypothetical protein KDB80_05345, partial [Planctomycetes bacterium]|nr:hypothetical protein [Planctomycetota bacterium]
LRYGKYVPREPDLERLELYLAESWQRRSDDTFFRGIRELPPAHWLRARLDGDRVRLDSERYWQLPPAEPGEITVEQVRELLDDSVRLRLRSDVPIGTSLSGGVDSPSVVASVRAVQHGKTGANFRYVGVHAYAEAPEADERSYVGEVAELLGLETALVELDGERCRAELDELVYRQDEPFLGPSIFAQRRVFERASDLGLKVMLDGQGADELFGGYDWVVPKVLAAEWTARGFGAMWRGARAFAGPRFPFWTLLRQVVMSRYRNRQDGLPDDLFDALRAALLDLSLPTLLRYADRNSMSFGVEARLPFLDHRLVEATTRLAAADIARDGFPKALLRDAMQDRLPERVLHRRDKTAFAVPETEWLRGPLAHDVLHATEDRIWHELPNGRAHVARAKKELAGGPSCRHAFKVLCAARWHDRFFVHSS